MKRRIGYPRLFRVCGREYLLLANRCGMARMSQEESGEIIVARTVDPMDRQVAECILRGLVVLRRCRTVGDLLERHCSPSSEVTLRDMAHILMALELAHSRADIAAACGVTLQRVNQILADPETLPTIETLECLREHCRALPPGREQYREFLREALDALEARARQRLKSRFLVHGAER